MDVHRAGSAMRNRFGLRVQLGQSVRQVPVWRYSHTVHIESALQPLDREGSLSFTLIDTTRFLERNVAMIQRPRKAHTPTSAEVFMSKCLFYSFFIVFSAILIGTISTILF